MGAITRGGIQTSAKIRTWRVSIRGGGTTYRC